MGLLDDAIREHLELKRRHGAAEEEVSKQAEELLGSAAPPEPEPEPDLPEEPAVEIPTTEDVVQQPTSEFTADDVAEAQGEPAPEYVVPDEEPGEDLLEETPDFLQETPEHERLWFEQKPPRDFDFGS
jgi:hypothetical protein